jgi:hypothetical protein
VGLVRFTAISNEHLWTPELLGAALHGAWSAQTERDVLGQCATSLRALALRRSNVDFVDKLDTMLPTWLSRGHLPGLTSLDLEYHDGRFGP